MSGLILPLLHIILRNCNSNFNRFLNIPQLQIQLQNISRILRCTTISPIEIVHQRLLNNFVLGFGHHCNCWLNELLAALHVELQGIFNQSCLLVLFCCWAPFFSALEVLSDFDSFFVGAVVIVHDFCMCGHEIGTLCQKKGFISLPSHNKKINSLLLHIPLFTIIRQQISTCLSGTLIP